MKGIVYGKYLERAKEQLDQIAEQYQRLEIDIDEAYKSLNCYRYIFTNGDSWQARGASESCRGLACNVAYVDRAIGKEIIQCIILPTIKAYPYRAVNYFGEPVEGEELWSINL